MVAFMPAENLVAIAEAPPTIDAALEKAVSRCDEVVGRIKGDFCDADGSATVAS